MIALNRQTKGLPAAAGPAPAAGWVLGLQLADNTCCGVHREPAQSMGPIQTYCQCASGMCCLPSPSMASLGNGTLIMMEGGRGRFHM